MFQHSVRTLRASFKFFRDNPSGRLVVNPKDGIPLPLNASEFRYWFRSALHRKINARGGLTIPADNIDLVRFHRTYTGTRIRLTSHELRRVALTIKELPTRHQFLLAFANRVDDDE